MVSVVVPASVKAALTSVATESVKPSVGGLRSRPKSTRDETAPAAVVRFPTASTAFVHRVLRPYTERVNDEDQLVSPVATVQPLARIVGSSTLWSVGLEAM